MNISKVAVIGTGTMGAGLAAYLAACNVEVLLFGRLPQDKNMASPLDPRYRNKKIFDCLDLIKKSKPKLYYDIDDLKLIKVGNLSDDCEKLKTCDLIIESVIENLDVKKEIFNLIEKHASPNAIITSNTSGFLWEKITEGRTQIFKRRFLITHFFNPVRYMKLVEVVANPQVGHDIVNSIKQFLEETLGKKVIFVHDTPNFIANRIGAFALMDAFHEACKHNWPVEAVDAVMGEAAARSKTGIFRTIDLVGLDILGNVALNNLLNCPADESREVFQIPQCMEAMLARDMKGVKSKKGFYKKEYEPSKKIFSMDLSDLKYRNQISFNPPTLQKTAGVTDPKERLKEIVFSSDQTGEIALPLVVNMLIYTANHAKEISDSIVDIDSAMRLGYNWELGPFEMWDAIGVKEIADRIVKDGLPSLIKLVLEKGEGVFYKEGAYFDLQTGTYKETTQNKNIIKIHDTCYDTVDKNDGASIIDIGDGVFCVEFHTKMNALDVNVMDIINRALDISEQNGKGLILYNEGKHFSVGANLNTVLELAEKKKWDDIKKGIRYLQMISQRLSYSKIPTIAIPFGYTFGAGCELSMACDKIIASAETYFSLPEFGVGLIPAGGGCKNMLLRNSNITAKGPFPKIKAVFEILGFGKISNSAKEAYRYGFMIEGDKYLLKQDELLFSAKKEIIKMAEKYQARQMQNEILLPGQGGKVVLLQALRDLKLKGLATEYDCVVGEKLAHVLTGGNVPTVCKLSEQDILDLECDAFVSLCGELKTRERIKYMLKNGKPLRN